MMTNERNALEIRPSGSADRWPGRIARLGAILLAVAPALPLPVLAAPQGTGLEASEDNDDFYCRESKLG